MTGNISFIHLRRIVRRLINLPSIQLRPAITLLVSAMLAGGSILLPGSALAAQQQICGNGGSGYCMNAWNGGPNVNMYNGNNSNEDFTEISVPQDCNHGKVSDGGTYGYCPFTNHTMDQALVNQTIVQLQDLNINSNYYADCVGGASGTGDLLPCGSPNGTGAGIGTIMVEYSSADCYSDGAQGYLVDRYWGDYYGGYAWVSSGGNPGRPLYVNDTSTSTCWGGFDL